MKIPKKIHIGHQTYTVQEYDEVFLKDAEKFGYCDPTNLKIAVVSKGVPKVNVINTIIHEVLHGLFREYNLPSEYEEHIVTCLANGLCQIFRDNKGLKELVQEL